MYIFEISDEAKKDLREILAYKAEYNPHLALVFIDKLVDRFEKLLSTFPNSGVMHNKRKNIRKITFEDYTAYYEFIEETETINILQIIDQGKPLEARGIEF